VASRSLSAVSTSAGHGQLLQAPVMPACSRRTAPGSVMWPASLAVCLPMTILFHRPNLAFPYATYRRFDGHTPKAGRRRTSSASPQRHVRHTLGAQPAPLGVSGAGRRSRVTSRIVTALPHHLTASRMDSPSSPVIVRSASPARLSASRTAPSRSPIAVSTSTARPSSRRSRVGTLSARYRLGIQRRPACCLPHRLLTRHSISPR
jgi:hypothetical protein